MTTPTTNPVPSTSPLDLLFNTERLDLAVNSGANTYPDRFGVDRLTLAGAVDSIRAVNVRGAWSTGASYSAKDVVSSGGTWYISLDAHIAGASFAGDQAAHWRVYQGLLASDVANGADPAKGAKLVGYHQSGGPATTVHDMLRERVSVVAQGADPTGTAESAAAFAAAIATGKLVYRPKGAYKRGGTTRIYPTDGYEGALWIGNGTTNNSSNARVIVSQEDDGSAGAAHGFTDSSIYTGSTSHNSYDDRTKVAGAGSGEHHASYQVGTEYAIAGGGTFGDHYGFVNTVTVSAGTLSRGTALQLNAPVVTGTGAVGDWYGVRFPLGFGKGGAGFNPATGTVLPIANESHAMIYSLGPVQGQDGVIAGNGAGTSYTPVKTIDAVTNAGTLAGLRLQQVGVQVWDAQNPASQTYLSFTSAAGEQLRLLNSGGIQAGADNASSLGSGSVRWSTVYAASGTINTSDERAKQDIGGIPVEWLRAWGRVEWTRYRFRDAAQAKGDGARWHVGLVAQRVRDVFAAAGIDALELGLLCHDTWADEWEAVPEERRGTSILDADGKPVTIIVRPAGRVKVREAGDRWGIRYDEALAMECAYLRWRAEGGV